MSTTSIPNKWAILIGVEQYLIDGRPPTTRRRTVYGADIHYEPLKGCINDILAVEDYLTKVLKVPSSNIEKLLSPRPGARYIAPIPRDSYVDATYDAIVRALRGMPLKAKEGDFVYIHYSGHGARASTIFGEARKTDPSRTDKDETLVPSDIFYGGRYVRDLELAVLLQEMAKNGLTVTATLDCCHSGGAMRGDGTDSVRFRGVSDVYQSNTESDMPDPEIMKSVAHWASQPSWFKSPEGYVVMTACLDTQKAAEHDQHGVFTFWMLHALRHGPLDISSDQLFECIRGRVQANAYNQTPEIIGDRNRFFFSKMIRSNVYALVVSRTMLEPWKSPKDRYVVLNGGAIKGIEIKSEYAILKFGHDLGLGVVKDAIVARVRITMVEADQSYAKVVDTTTASLSDVFEGCAAVLLKLPLAKRSSVRFDTSGASDVSEEMTRAWQRHQESGGRTWLELHGDADNGDASFSVTVNNGHFEISDRAGIFTPALNNVLRPLPARNLEQAMPSLIRRLEHLARFNMTRSLLDPYPGFSSSTSLISISEVKPAAAPKHVNGELWHRASNLIEKQCNKSYEVEDKTWITITFKNNTSQDLNIAVLNCGAEFSVSKIFPPRDEHHKLKAGCVFDYDVGFQIAPEIESATILDGEDAVDMIKVFASPFPISVEALQLESLNDMERRQLHGMRGGNWSEDFKEVFENLEADRGAVGSPSSGGDQPMGWQIVDVLFQIKKRPGMS